jgi:hypothetical protein
MFSKIPVDEVPGNDADQAADNDHPVDQYNVSGQKT